MPAKSHLTRRRFLTLCASAPAMGLASAARASTQIWRGQAFGAEVSLELSSDVRQLQQDLDAVVQELRQIEARFSIYLPSSELSQLNARGRIAVSEEMHEVLRLVRRVHLVSEGLFDPTIQPLWQALSDGRDTTEARALIGFERVEIGSSHVRLAPGQKLSLNGIAQGYATDRITALLRQRGYDHALVNMGEFRAMGGPYHLGMSDPEAGQLGRLSLTDGAVASSSPGAMRVGDETHILHPKGGVPLWSTVTVQARSAALADAVSTAFCLMPRNQIARVCDRLDLGPVVMVDFEGNLETL